MDLSSNTSSPTLFTAKSPEVVAFVAALQAKLDAHRKETLPNYPHKLQIIPALGPTFIKIIREETDAAGAVFHRSAFCFIKRLGGDVLKAASWNAPAKGARGNITDAHGGLGRVTPYGVESNR